MVFAKPPHEWPSAELQAGGGDHSIAEVVFDTLCPQALAEWRHAKTPKEALDSDHFSPVPWSEVAVRDAVWQTALGSVDTAWAAWTSDVEEWLRASHALSPERLELHPESTLRFPQVAE